MESPNNSQPEHDDESDKTVPEKKESPADENEFELPAGQSWFRRDRTYADFTFKCPDCNKEHELTGYNKNLSCKSDTGKLTPTDRTSTFPRSASRVIAKILGGVMAVGLGTLIGSAWLGIPYVWAVIAVISYVVFWPISEAIVMRIPVLGCVSPAVWTFECAKCKQNRFMASTNSAVYWTKPDSDSTGAAHENNKDTQKTEQAKAQ